FQRVLSAEIRPVIIHFIGHGVLNEGRTALVFEDPLGVAEPFTIEALTLLLRTSRKPICKLAVINACHSDDFASILTECGVAHVVAVSAEDNILDCSARAFARGFYPGLLRRLSVQEAFQNGRYSLQGDSDVLQALGRDKGQIWNEVVKFKLHPEDASRHA